MKKQTNQKRASTTSKPTSKGTSKPTTIKKNTETSTKKIQRADELRVESNKEMQKLERINRNWGKALSETKSIKERRKIDNKYSEKFEKVEEKERRSYSKYSNYVHNNFDKERIDYALNVSNNFMSKKFINALGNKNE